MKILREAGLAHRLSISIQRGMVPLLPQVLRNSETMTLIVGTETTLSYKVLPVAHHFAVVADARRPSQEDVIWGQLGRGDGE